MRKKVFITGGAGFIGSRLVKRIAPEVEEIAVFDNLHPQVHGKNALPPSFPDNARFIKGDIADGPALSSAVAALAPDVIYHLAAETGTGQSHDEPARYCAANILGAAYLVEALRRLPQKRRRVVLAGTRAVYGEGAYLTEDGALAPARMRRAADLRAGLFTMRGDDGKPLIPTPTREDLPPAPASVYASSKLMQEHLLTQCEAAGEFEAVILRFQNVYGPGQSLKNPYTGVLSIFAAQILKGDRLRIFEDGEIVRDFVYVDDVVDALVLAGSVKTAPSGPINIGSGYPASIREAAEILLEALGSPRDRYDITGQFRAGDVRHATADISRASDMLDWRPKTSLKDGLSELARWARTEYQKT